MERNSAWSHEKWDDEDEGFLPQGRTNCTTVQENREFGGCLPG